MVARITLNARPDLVRRHGMQRGRLQFHVEVIGAYGDENGSFENLDGAVKGTFRMSGDLGRPWSVVRSLVAIIQHAVPELGFQTGPNDIGERLTLPAANRRADVAARTDVNRGIRREPPPPPAEARERCSAELCWVRVPAPYPRIEELWCRLWYGPHGHSPRTTATCVLCDGRHPARSFRRPFRTLLRHERGRSRGPTETHPADHGPD